MRDHTRIHATCIVAALVAGIVMSGCARGPQRVALEIRLMEDTPQDTLTEMTMHVWGGEKKYYAHNNVLMDEHDVTAAMVLKQDDGTPAMELIFTGDARRRLQQITGRNVGRRLGVIVDGQLQCAPRIDEPNNTGLVLVTGHMLERAAKRCSQALTRQTPRDDGGAEA